VNNGWLLRYVHANGVSLFFMKVYVHKGKGLYYGSYRSPRRALWIVGVLIFIIKKATAFIGYV
jgi:ubiquinol-cytochrome c reductase cytochrome b subunit